MIGLNKTARDLAFYPASHPSLAHSLDRACHNIIGLLTHHAPLTITVTRESLQYGKLPLGKDNSLLRQFAADLHLRRIQRILFAKGLDAAEVLGFLEMLSMDPKHLMQEGGPVRVLQAKGVSRLQISELEVRFHDEPQAAAPAVLDQVVGDPAEAVAPPEPAEVASEPPPPEEPPTLENLLNHLEDAWDVATYQRAAARLIEWGRTARTGDDLEAFVRIFSAFVFHTHPQSVKPPWVRPEAEHAITALGDPSGIEYLIRKLCQKDHALDDDLIFLLVALGDAAVPPLVERLAEEETLSARRKLMGTLSRLGPVALPRLTAALKDSRWYLVRNLALVLGNIGLPKAIPSLRSVLAHADLRVRREAVKAMTRIGTSAAADALLERLGDPDPGARQSVMAALGTLKVTRAIGPLAEVARHFSALAKEVETQKAAILALGAIGDPQVVPGLVALLCRQTWLNRRLNEEVRAAAAAALGMVGGEQATAALLAEAKRGKGPVPSACQVALDRLMGAG
jgi:HEAT repeat protein